MASWTQQALLEASPELIWELLSDPARHPEWAGDALETTGVPTKIEKGATFEQTSRGPLGMKATTTFEVAELEDLREIKLVCQMTGYFAHWRLTEAQDQTFADVEIGIDPNGVPGRVKQVIMTKRALRQVTNDRLEGIRRALGRG